MGKVANRRPTDLCPQESPEKAEIRAGHANVSNVETVEIGYVVGRAQKFDAQHVFAWDKASRKKNDDDARNFALNGGRFGGGYEQKSQQSTT